VAAAEAVLTWRLVDSQVVDDDERFDVTRQLENAEKDLKAAVRSAFQHYAYLIRRGEDLDVQFCRFDDDKATALSGDDVWSALVLAGRAVGSYYDPIEKRRKRRELGESYVATLLDGFDRHLTMKEVFTSFYKNPAFPLVPSLDEIRQVIYDLIQPDGHNGEGTGGWELIDSAGARLEPQNPDQLAINSIQQQVRRARPTTSDDATTQSEVPDEHGATGHAQQGGTAGSPPTGEHVEPKSKELDSYSWYRLDIVNRSIADSTRREDVRKVLLWLSAKLDDDLLDLQLITLKLELNAASSDELSHELEQRAKGVDANRWGVEESF
jgi:hypothetical protein